MYDYKSRYLFSVNLINYINLNPENKYYIMYVCNLLIKKLDKKDNYFLLNFKQKKLLKSKRKNVTKKDIIRLICNNIIIGSDVIEYKYMINNSNNKITIQI